MKKTVEVDFKACFKISDRWRGSEMVRESIPWVRGKEAEGSYPHSSEMCLGDLNQ
jgi:hypothetical protein